MSINTLQVKQRFKIKQIYGYASDDLSSWCPLLPLYEA